MKRRFFVAASGSAAFFAACGGGGSDSSGSGGVGSTPSAQNAFAQANLVSSAASDKALFTIPDFTDAWGIAIRPAGAGGHFWIAGGSSSWQFLGDVQNASDASLRELKVDQLTQVTIDTGAAPPTHPTGIAFNGAPLASGNFVPTGQVMNDNSTTPPTPVTMQGSARFIFVTDSGNITAWTERRQDTGAVMRNNGATQVVYSDATATTPLGAAFFGVAVKTDTWDTLWLADFGTDPQIRQMDASWNLVPTVGFANPFGTGAAGAVKPGDFVPFNIQVLAGRVFVLYAKSQVSPTDISKFNSGTEDSMDADAEKASGFAPDRGRLVEYSLTGSMVRVFKDEKHLNSPWGVAIAPAAFGAFAGTVLVGNFGGGGYITAFDGSNGSFLGYLRRPDGGFVAIPGLWGLQFGNGASLGDSDALYFAAGSNDEAAGLFGSLRYSPK